MDYYNAGSLPTVKDQTYYIMLDMIQNYIIEYSTGCDRQEFVHDPESYLKLRKICDSVILANRETFDEIIHRYPLHEILRDIHGTLSSGISWGQIISSVSLGAYVSKELRECNIYLSEYLDKIPEIITDGILSNNKDWLKKNNFWKGLYIFKVSLDAFHALKLSLRIASAMITCLSCIKALSRLF